MASPVSHSGFASRMQVDEVRPHDIRGFEVWFATILLLASGSGQRTRSCEKR